MPMSKRSHKAFGDWCIQLSIGLISGGGVVGVAANVWMGIYALAAGSILFLIGVRYKYS